MATATMLNCWLCVLRLWSDAEGFVWAAADAVLPNGVWVHRSFCWCLATAIELSFFLFISSHWPIEQAAIVMSEIESEKITA